MFLGKVDLRLGPISEKGGKGDSHGNVDLSCFLSFCWPFELGIYGFSRMTWLKWLPAETGAVAGDDDRNSIARACGLQKTV